MENLTFIKTNLYQEETLNKVLELYNHFTSLGYNTLMVLLEHDQQRFIPQIPIFSGLELLEIKGKVISLDDNAFNRALACDSTHHYFFPLESEMFFYGKNPITTLDQLTKAVTNEPEGH